MKHHYLLKIVFSVLISLFSLALAAQDDIMSVKSRPILVNDDADLFSTSERIDLEQMLVAYNDSTSTQIAVITTKSLNGYAPGDYATRLGEEWGVGQKGKRNGIVILIKPRIGNERGEVYIATGYGVEHILTDARVGRIIDNYMIPYLPDDYYRATKTAATAMIQMLSGEFQADEVAEGGDMFMTLFIAFLLLAIIVYAISKSSKNDGGDNWMDNDRNSGGGSGRSTTYFPSSRGFGRSSSGGRSSGGFGGFGGGSFGGGGAGRSF